MKRWFLILSVLLNSAAALAAPKAQDLVELNTLLARGSSLPTFVQRLDFYSEQMLGRFYDFVGPLGEGENAPFDRAPLWRFDTFDCTTYVETMVSLAKSQTRGQFENTMNRIRYKDGIVAFQNRNHFTGLDWIPNNTANGLVRDITTQVAPSAAAVAQAIVDKKSWYEHLAVNRLVGIPPEESAARLQELRHLGADMTPALETVPYLKKEILIAHPELLENIPEGAILNIVRPNFDLMGRAGTHLNITHQGFAIRKNGQIYFREASELEGVVFELPLIDYLRQVLEHSQSMQGLNILQIQ